MNTIGIEDDLNRERIKKLLIIGAIASVMTGIGDFLLGYADETAGVSLATSVMSSAPNLTDAQMIAGSLLGLVGIFLEGLAYFAVYRLMADASPKYAHAFRTCIFGYIWLAPVGCHLNMGILNMAYKYLLLADEQIAQQAATPLFCWFSLPVYVLMVCFWLPMMIIQFKAFAKGLTPYPARAKWFAVLTGGIPVLLVSALLGSGTALGAGVGTTFLSVGNLLVFGGLLATLPSQERFDAFREKIGAQA